MNEDLVWADIDLDAISGNVEALKKITSPGARFMAVVKADGYGHGAVQTAKAALAAGADRLGVARLHEALPLREAGIDAPVLVFGYTPEPLIPLLIRHGITQTVYSTDAARALSKAAVAASATIRVHVKIDTGMGRLGLVPDALGAVSLSDETAVPALDAVRAISRLPGLELEGVYTHFALSDGADKSYTKFQFNLFTDFLAALAASGLSVPIRHAANSGAIIDHPETHLDMVRAGISIYGLYPSDEVDRSRAALTPAMALKSRIVHLKKAPKGFKVSYGCTWETPGETTLATVPVGYADGYNRLLSNTGSMAVRGVPAPIVGRVCMDQTLIDVGHIPDVRVFDEVAVFGGDGPSADEVAGLLKTINYEVVSGLTSRPPRRYRGVAAG